MLADRAADACRVSEQRAVDLLDDLCSEMGHYTLIPQDSDSSSTDSNTSSSDPGSSAAAVAADPNSLGSTKESTMQELAWVKRKGKGGTNVPASRR